MIVAGGGTTATGRTTTPTGTGGANPIGGAATSGGTTVTAHLFAFYGNIYHKDLTPGVGAGHATPEMLAFLPYVVAPLLAVVMIGMNAACNPNTNTKR